VSRGGKVVSGMVGWGFGAVAIEFVYRMIDVDRLFEPER
jgi:hypothetical protein